MSTDNSAGTTSELSPKFATKQSRLISKVLSPAVGLWLRSQVQQVSHLEVKISGSDRQILAGYIPQVSVLANHAVYQGLHLSQIELVGAGIRINLGQVIRGQPLRLLETVSVFCWLELQESDLNASLSSVLLSNALTDLARTLFTASFSGEEHMGWQKIAIAPQQLTIYGTSAVDPLNPTPLVIRTDLQLASCHQLQLVQPLMQTPTGLLEVKQDIFSIDLGSEVALEELTISSGKLLCRGKINVMPSE